MWLSSWTPKPALFTELVDFSTLMDGYYGAMTHPVPLTGSSFWQAGEDDWLHLNSVQYRQADDSILVSSRETSTIVQVSGVHSTPTLTALIGDPAFWAGTEYESLSYQPQGDFVPQYGQHDVELVEDDSLPEGQYLLRMYDNNYWSLSTRDDYEPELPDSVGTSLTGGSGIHSYVTYYLVDSNAKTFSLAKQFPVTYSSIVSNAQSFDGNYVVNSGVAHEFGEYDSEGNLIRAFSYDCMMNGYRVMKGDFEGFLVPGGVINRQQTRERRRLFCGAPRFLLIHHLVQAGQRVGQAADFVNQSQAHRLLPRRSRCQHPRPAPRFGASAG